MKFQPDWEALGVLVAGISAFATVVVGWAAVRIARGQTKAALFDRRFKAYRDLASGIASMKIDGAIYPKTYETLKEAVHLARFLYSRPIVGPLEELQTHAYHAWLLRPLENHGRDVKDYDEAERHMRAIENIWSSVQPLMEKSLQTWADRN
ncbi:hypothetical protein [Brevundimonas sp. GCM10030266]|uniref:hypothetical protein n=1 Tax=Brevundimonas sp. GCM10030266 TaxID=3273386 RepID=UPI003613F2BD